MVICLFTRDIETSVRWPVTTPLMTGLGALAIGITIFIIGCLLVWTWDDMVAPTAQLRQRRKNRDRKARERAMTNLRDAPMPPQVPGAPAGGGNGN